MISLIYYWNNTMRIIVLHGTDTQKSYERLTKFIDEAKKRQWQITDYSLQDIENQSLFDENKFYILKDYKLLDKKVVEKLKKYTGNLIVYTAGLHPAIHLKMLNPDKTEKFELPQLLWKFLDKMTTEGLHQLIKTNAPEYILAMIAWKLKQNYLKNPTPHSSLLISRLAEIDIKSKTSNASLPLLLDLFIAKHIQ